VSRNELRCDPLLCPDRVSRETRETTKGSAELKFRIQFPPAGSLRTFGSARDLFSTAAQTHLPLSLAVEFMKPADSAQVGIKGGAGTRRLTDGKPSSASALRDGAAKCRSNTQLFVFVSWSDGGAHVRAELLNLLDFRGSPRGS